MKAFPKPVSDQVQLSIQSASVLSVKIIVLDANGKQLRRYNEQVLPVTNVFTYPDTRSLPNGLYYMTLNLGEDYITHKFSIQK